MNEPACSYHIVNGCIGSYSCTAANVCSQSWLETHIPGIHSQMHAASYNCHATWVLVADW
jgi:hypothetical protein